MLQLGVCTPLVRLQACYPASQHGLTASFVSLVFSSQWPTLPQLYVKGEFVGGCDIVSDMHKSGELAELLADFVKK